MAKPIETRDEDALREATRPARRRGRLYTALAWVVLAGFLAVAVAAAANVGGLGFFELGTAMTMIGIAIAALATGLIVTLFSLRRTFVVLESHEASLVAQARAHADLAARLQQEHDREQDAELRDLAELQEDALRRLESSEAARLEARRAENAAREQALERTPRAKGPSPFGAVRPVIDVEGIGPVHSDALRSMGIHDTRQLWQANPTYVAGRLAVSPKTVAAWQEMAELMTVRGVGPQFSELLVRSGVDSIDALSKAEPGWLYRRVSDTNEAGGHRIQRGHLTPKLVASWVEAARARARRIEAAPIA